MVHTKYEDVVNVGAGRKVVLSYQGLNTACSACLRILKDRSESHFLKTAHCFCTTNFLGCNFRFSCRIHLIGRADNLSGMFAIGVLRRSQKKGGNWKAQKGTTAYDSDQRKTMKK